MEPSLLVGGHENNMNSHATEDLKGRCHYYCWLIMRLPWLLGENSDLNVWPQSHCDHVTVHL